MQEFPDNFVWGVATAAYQIEGAWDQDDRGWSIWDSFAHCQGRVSKNATGDTACDHYNRFQQDVQLLASLGIRTYRFSISWSRVQPTGRGPANPKGLMFYDRLVDCLLQHGIAPVVTLYHWDLPLALQVELGGWLSPDIVPLFADYARIVFRLLGGRVRWWITLNEPWCCAVFGYGKALHAPGITSKDASQIYRAGHHLLLAHAAAAEVFRREVRAKDATARIGIALNANWVEPAGARGELSARLNGQAAERALAWNVGWFADPIWKGDYPAVMRRRCGERLPQFTQQESEMLRGSSDFFGLNHYTTDLAEPELFGADLERMHDLWLHVVDHPTGKSDNYIWGDMLVKLSRDEGAPQTDMGWPIVPSGFTRILCWVQQQYHPSGGIVVTENGMGCKEPTLQGALQDKERIEYLHSYISAMHEAIRQGADVRGYFAWTLLDNFEWHDGYDYRFGIVHVDFETLQRTPKSSASWYSAVIRHNGLAPLQTPPPSSLQTGMNFELVE